MFSRELFEILDLRHLDLGITEGSAWVRIEGAIGILISTTDDIAHQSCCLKFIFKIDFEFGETGGAPEYIGPSRVVLTTIYSRNSTSTCSARRGSAKRKVGGL